MPGYRPANRGNRTPSTARVGQRVSRKLKAAGWKVSPAARKNRYDGMFVSAMGDFVSVLFDLGSPTDNKMCGESLAEQMRTWPQASGVEVKPVGETDAIFVNFTWKD